MDIQENKLEIRVSTKTNSQALAGSITNAYIEGKEISLAAIGPLPISQAFKAVCIANKTLASRGTLLCIVPGLESRELLDRETQKPVPWVVSVLRLMDILSRENGN